MIHDKQSAGVDLFLLRQSAAAGAHLSSACFGSAGTDVVALPIAYFEPMTLVSTARRLHSFVGLVTHVGPSIRPCV
jgi:hypothetical protein